MPTTFSILELIMQNVETTINGITTANNYEVTAHARRIMTNTDEPSPNDGDVEVVRRATRMTQQQTGKDDYEVDIDLHCYLLQTRDTEIPIDQRLNAYECALRKALMVNAQRGTHPDTNNPLAINTIFINDCEPWSMVDYEGFTLQVRIQFRTAENNPYSH